MTETEQRKLAALEALLAGLPPYPEGTMVREAQDELEALRKKLGKRHGQAPTSQ